MSKETDDMGADRPGITAPAEGVSILRAGAAVPHRYPPATPDVVAAAARANADEAKERADHARVNVKQYDFPTAMCALLAGERISRMAWARGFMIGDFVTMAEMPYFRMAPRPRVGDFDPGATVEVIDVNMGPHMLRRRVDQGKWTAWTPEQPDFFAKDWIVI